MDTKSRLSKLLLAITMVVLPPTLAMTLSPTPTLTSAPAWSDAVNISNTSGSSSVPKIAADGAGTIHVVWCDSTPGNSDLFYASKPSDGNWSLPVNVSQNSGNCTGPTLAIATDGTLHTAWSDQTPGGFNIFYASKPSGGSWTSPVNISNAGAQNLYDAQLVISSDGTLHLVWQNAGDQHSYYATKPFAGEWSAPSQIYDQQGDSLGLAIDSADTLHFAWRVSDRGASTNIYYLTKPSGGTWSGSSLISDCAGITYCSYPVILARGNTFHLVFQRRSLAGPPDQDLYYMTKVGSGAWTSPTAIVLNAGDSQAFSEGLAVDSTGKVSLVWYDDTSGNYEVLYSELSAGTWAAPINLSNTSTTSEYPAIALDGNDFTHVVWSDYVSGITEIYYRTTAPEPPTPTPTDTSTSTPTHTDTPTSTPTYTPTFTPTETTTPTHTPTSTYTPTLVPFNFTGFFEPVDNVPTLNVLNAGKGVAVKFSLGGYQGLDIFMIGYPTSSVVPCGSTAEDAIEQTITVGSSGLTYDASSDQYTYVWKTDKAWAGTCRTLVVKLSDGTSHWANFKFK